MTTTNKRTNKGFLLSVSVLSAFGLLAALPLSVSAQEETIRDNAAAETSPANPVNDAEMMLDAEGNIIDAESEGVTGVTRDNAAAETSPANPVNDDDMMMGDMDDDDDMMMGDMDDDDDDMMVNPTVSNNPRALW